MQIRTHTHFYLSTSALIGSVLNSPVQTESVLLQRKYGTQDKTSTTEWSLPLLCRAIQTLYTAFQDDQNYRVHKCVYYSILLARLVKVDEMDVACGKQSTVNKFEAMVGKSEGKRKAWRSRRRMYNNIKIDVKK